MRAGRGGSLRGQGRSGEGLATRIAPGKGHARRSIIGAIWERHRAEGSKKKGVGHPPPTERSMMLSRQSRTVREMAQLTRLPIITSVLLLCPQHASANENRPQTSGHRRGECSHICTLRVTRGERT